MENNFLQIDANDLREFFLEILNEFSCGKKTNEVESITTGDVCKMLNVTRPTLWRWNNSGYLRNIHVGGKTMYKLDDVLKIKNGGRNNER